MAVLAGVLPLPTVEFGVDPQLVVRAEHFATFAALVFPLCRVRARVPQQLGTRRVRFIAVLAGVTLGVATERGEDMSRRCGREQT